MRSGITGAMTNRIALWIAVLIAALLAVDYWYFGVEHLVFLGRKFFALLNWVAFWR